VTGRSRSRCTTAMTDSCDGPDGRPEGGAGPTGRLVGLTDGVFAIAITLLVLPLTDAHLTDAGLPEELLALWPQLLAFANSFLVIGRLWLIHHRLFRHLAREDERLRVLNLLVLAEVAFLPFPTKVLGEHGLTPAACVFYAVSVAGTVLAFVALWAYASRGRRLVHPHADPALIRRLRRQGLIVPTLYVMSIPVALASPPAAWGMWWLYWPATWLIERRF
jgi:uncharacterized membrane protein